MHDTVSVLRLFFTPTKARFERMKSCVADDEQPQRGIQGTKPILDISQKIKRNTMNQSPVMNEPDQSAADADPLQGQEDQPPSFPIGQSEAKLSGLAVELFDSTGLVSEASQSEIINLAKRALVVFPNQGEIRVRVVDDAQMSADHQQFSGITGTTDVLTFDLSEPTDDVQSKMLDVDLTICFDEARRQSARLNHRVEHELLLYIIHGTLHCLGYNDHDQDEYQRMHEKEDSLLSTLGLPPTFFASHDSPSEGAQS